MLYKTNTMKKVKLNKLSLNKERVSELSQGNMKEVNGGRRTSVLHCVLNTNLTCDTNEVFCIPATQFQCWTFGVECE